MPRAGTRLAYVLGLILATAPSTQVASIQSPGGMPKVRDYPHADRAIWTAERDALLRKSAAERRADRSDVADVVAFLANQDRGLEAVSLAREAMRLQPSRMRDIAAAFAEVGSTRALSDPSSGFKEALRVLVAEMHARLTDQRPVITRNSFVIGS
jgi:hypothetical protein